MAKYRTVSGNNRARFAFAGVSVLALSMAYAAPAYAQTGENQEVAQNSSGVGTIVVTAQRREQTVLDVPVSATVITGETLREQNAQSALDYLLETPNVSFRQDGRNGAREIVVSIRGISDLKGGEKVSTQSAFTTFVDGFSAGTLASGQANPNIYDVEAVEILRGPQGVFFGRNAEGGAINIRTRRPQPELGGQFDIGYGRFNTWELAGVANVPVTDTLYTRLSVQGTRTDSYLRNAHPTGGNGGNEYLNIRAQLRWVPTPSTTIDLQINHTVDNQDYTPKLATCINPTFGFNPFDQNVLGGIGCYDPNGAFTDAVQDGTVVLPSGVTLASINDNRRLTYQNTPEFTNNDATVFLGTLEHVFNDSVSLTSITGYARSVSDQLVDLDKSGVDSIDRTGYFETSSFSQEIRIASVGENTLDWTIGGIYYDESSDAENKIIIQDLIGPWLRGDYANENNIGVDREGWSVFGNVEWHFTDALSVIFGLRYSHDEDSQDWTNVYAACPRRALGDPLAPGCTLRPDHVINQPTQIDGNGNVLTTGGRQSQTAGAFGENSTNDVTGQIALNWNPNDDLNIYASIARGYKPGGARANPDGGTLSNVSLYDSESLTNYEIGGNAYLFDRRMLVQFAAFWMEWRDMQVELRESFCTNDPANPIPLDDYVGNDCLITPLDRTVNANSARSRGFELSTIIRPVNGLQLSGGVGFVDAEFTDFRDTVRNTPADLTGQRLGNAPRWTAFAGARYEFDLGDWDAHIGAKWNYRGASSRNVVQTAANRFPTLVPAFATVDLNAGIDFGNHALTFNVINALGSDYFTGSDGFSYGGTMLDYHPTEWMIRWSVRM